MNLPTGFNNNMILAENQQKKTFPLKKAFFK